MNKLENANLMNSILIVEDDANVRQSLENLIGKSGYNVVSEYSGPRAVKRMLDDSRKDISIVLMDIRMPGDYDGIEAARRITAARPDASLIFVSGFTEVAERIEDVKLDVAGWIPKPIVGRTADNLLASIDKVVEAKFRDSIQKERSKEGALDDKEDQISKDSNLIKPELILPVTQDIVVINRKLKYRFINNSKELWNVDPRLFEELIAELFEDEGYDVILTPERSDGGQDLYVSKKDVMSESMFLVECKRYVPPNKVGVEITRQLFGLVQSENASGGIIVTTSFFTKGAEAFAGQFPYQLILHDFDDLSDWLKRNM